MDIKDDGDLTYTAPVWKDVLKSFMDTFLDKGLKKKALSEIMGFVQGSKSFRDYGTEFQILFSHSGMEHITGITLLEKGTNEALAQKVAILQPKPSTVEEWIAEANNLQTIWEGVRRGRTNAKPTFTPKTSTWKKPEPKSAVQAKAVTTGTPIPKLTPELRAQCIKEGRCFKCREQGHLSGECRKVFPPRPPFQVQSRAMEVTEEEIHGEQVFEEGD
jgi:hypothetical protein